MSALSKKEIQTKIDEDFTVIDCIFVSANSEAANEDLPVPANVFTKWLWSITQSSYEAWAKHSINISNKFSFRLKRAVDSSIHLHHDVLLTNNYQKINTY